MKRPWRAVLTGFVLVTAFVTNAQSVDHPSSLFYAGTAQASDVETARLRAYQNLVQQIQVFVSSTLRRTLTESDAGVSDSSSASTIALSLLTLRDVEEEAVRLDDGSYRVSKFATRESVRKFFGERRKRIMDHIAIAHGALHRQSPQCDAAAALKHLYAASLELALYPDTIDASFSLIDARAFGVSQAGIGGAIEAIASAIRFTPLRQIDDDYIVWKYTASLNGRPVSSLHMSFYDGIGQTDTDVSNGEALLTFYFAKNGHSSKNITAYIEYGFGDEPDASLRMADSLQLVPASHPSFTFVVPANPEARSGSIARADDRSDQAGGALKLASAGTTGERNTLKTMPDAIRALADVKGDFDALVRTLDDLQKRHAIVAGSARSFESLEDLYAVVVAKGEEAILLHHEQGKLNNIITGEQALLSQFAGRRLIWIEVFK